MRGREMGEYGGEGSTVAMGRPGSCPQSPLRNPVNAVDIGWSVLTPSASVSRATAGGCWP